MISDTWKSATAFQLSHEQVEKLFATRLSAILRREVEARLLTDNDYWDVTLIPHLTEQEIELLFSYANADAGDRAEHPLCNGVVRDLDSRFALKLIAADFPAPVKSAFPAEEVMYFFSEFEPFEKVYWMDPEGAR